MTGMSSGRLAKTGSSVSSTCTPRDTPQTLSPRGCVACVSSLCVTHLLHGLQELGLGWVALLHGLIHCLQTRPSSR